MLPVSRTERMSKKTSSEHHHPNSSFLAIRAGSIAGEYTLHLRAVIEVGDRIYMVPSETKQQLLGHHSARRGDTRVPERLNDRGCGLQDPPGMGVPSQLRSSPDPADDRFSSACSRRPVHGTSCGTNRPAIGVQPLQGLWCKS
jgi:hypothetical protein